MIEKVTCRISTYNPKLIIIWEESTDKKKINYVLSVTIKNYIIIASEWEKKMSLIAKMRKRKMNGASFLQVYCDTLIKLFQLHNAPLHTKAVTDSR